MRVIDRLSRVFFLLCFLMVSSQANADSSDVISEYLFLNGINTSLAISTKETEFLRAQIKDQLRPIDKVDALYNPGGSGINIVDLMQVIIQKLADAANDNKLSIGLPEVGIIAAE